MIVYFAVLVYATAMTAANLLVSHFGPSITPINAFFLIGLTLTMRDFLHVRISQKKMLALILVSGAITYVVPASQRQQCSGRSSRFNRFSHGSFRCVDAAHHCNAIFGKSHWWRNVGVGNQPLANS
jgi:hypothetical protein